MLGTLDPMNLYVLTAGDINRVGLDPECIDLQSTLSL